MSDSIIKKYRPKTFSQVVGQTGSVYKITAALTSGVIPPAYLFSGIQGGGKTTNARLVTMSLNCQQRVGVEPCGQCQQCKDILNDCSSYLIELDGAQHGKVEDIRGITGTVSYVVPDGNYKVVIIDECHGLSKAAWNALLKTIEEPPKNVLFIFCTTELQKVQATIRSRCVHIQFPGVTDDVITKIIKHVCAEEKATIDDESVQLITKYAFGSIRDAQSILEGFIRMGKITADQVKQTFQTLDPNTILTYFNSVLEKNIKSASNMTRGWLRLGVGPEGMINGLLDHLRNMIMDFIVEDKAMKSLLKTQKEKIGEGRVADWIEFFYDQLQFLREYPMEYTLTIDLITIKLIDSMSVRTSGGGKRAKKGEGTEVAVETTTEAVAPVQEGPILPLDREKVSKLKNICGGLVVNVDTNFRRITLRNNKGTIFDVTAHPSLAKSDFYVMGHDLDKVIEGYPESMETFVKTK